MSDCDRCSKKKIDLFLVRKARSDGSIKETWVCEECYEKLATKVQYTKFKEIEGRIPCLE